MKIIDTWNSFPLNYENYNRYNNLDMMLLVLSICRKGICFYTYNTFKENRYYIIDIKSYTLYNLFFAPLFFLFALRKRKKKDWLLTSRFLLNVDIFIFSQYLLLLLYIDILLYIGFSTVLSADVCMRSCATLQHKI